MRNHKQPQDAFVAPKKTRAQEVYEALRRDILDWVLEPGQALSESMLTERLGASRTPVREALQHLSRDGLVRVIPGRGAFVTEMSMMDVVEVFELREMLEALAAGLAAAKPKTENVQHQIVELMDRFQKFRDANPTEFDRDAYYELTSEMDQLVLSVAGNERLSAMLRDLGAESRRMRRFASSDTQRLIASATEHIGILASIRDGDRGGAEDAVREHVQSSRKNILAGIATGSSHAEPREVRRG